MNKKVVTLLVILVIATGVSFKIGMGLGNRIVVDSKYVKVTDLLNKYNEKQGILNRFTEDEVRDDNIMLEFMSKLENPKTTEDIAGILSNNTKSVFAKREDIADIVMNDNVEILKGQTVYVKKVKERDINKIKYGNIIVLSLIVALILQQLEYKYLLPTLLMMGLISIIIYINLK